MDEIMQALSGEEKPQTEERFFDQTLRPKTLADFVGQVQLKENLSIMIEAAKRRQTALEHILFYGNPGLGKTTLATIIANEFGSTLRTVAGPMLERVGDIAAILTNLTPGDVLFIDEIHRLNRSVEEVLYSAMEEYALDLVIGKGPAARTLRIDLPRFTLVGATTRMSLLSSPLRDRFGVTYRLNFYEPDEIGIIIKRSAAILNVPIEESAVRIIAARSRGTPRVANRLLRRVRDFAEVKGTGAITHALAEQALASVEVDSMGLDEVDRQLLLVFIEKFAGGPVGLGSLAAATQEEEPTIEEIYEPYLIKLGFLERTPRGRMATTMAYKHLGAELPARLL